jgi:hypothetical protein
VHRKWEGYSCILGGCGGLIVGLLSFVFSGQSFLIFLFPVLGVIAAQLWNHYSGMFWGGLVILFILGTQESEAWYGVGCLVLLEIVMEVSKHFLRAPLHRAAKKGELGKVEILLNKGADIDGVFDGVAPLHIAAHLGRRDLIELLLAHGAQIEIRSRHEATPLLSAAFNGDRKTVEMLVKAGADLGAKNAAGQTALHMAAYGGYGDLAEFLLAAGVDTLAKTTSGSTAAGLAAEQGHHELAKRLGEGPLVR